MNPNLASEHIDWRSRLYIPHFDQANLVQLITIRLNDAVPQALIEEWKRELDWAEKMPANDSRGATLRIRIERYEDIGYGSCWLREERIAAMVEQGLFHFDAVRYRILAWCIMPNHAHVVAEIWEQFHLDRILHSWKSYTAHEANRMLRRSGAFWFREYYDRYIRNEQHLADAIEYVESNPVMPGL